MLKFVGSIRTKVSNLWTLYNRAWELVSGKMYNLLRVENAELIRELEGSKEDWQLLEKLKILWLIIIFIYLFVHFLTMNCENEQVIFQCVVFNNGVIVVCMKWPSAEYSNQGMLYSFLWLQSIEIKFHLHTLEAQHSFSRFISIGILVVPWDLPSDEVRIVVSNLRKGEVQYSNN